ncbi:MAG: methylmalonyl-CoA mutase [Desulfobacteraceae bacterium 4484_190.1]|nr:MAG: methylmalonyl-CoA mutase [Desulfobacteraceae bacterium 4484_190.1]
MPDRIRVLMSKIGLDGHDRGIRVVVSFLREAGVEVIFIGRFQTPVSIVNSAMQEDVDVIGISSLTGEYAALVPELLDNLKEHDLESIPVVVGGIIPPKDIDKLKEIGVSEVFPAGSSMKSIVEYMVKIGKKHKESKKIVR